MSRILGLGSSGTLAHRTGLAQACSQSHIHISLEKDLATEEGPSGKGRTFSGASKVFSASGLGLWMTWRVAAVPSRSGSMSFTRTVAIWLNEAKLATCTQYPLFLCSDNINNAISYKINHAILPSTLRYYADTNTNIRMLMLGLHAG